MPQILTKFLSRKLAIAVMGVAGSLATGQPWAALGVAVAYVLSQAHVDAATVQKDVGIGEDAVHQIEDAVVKGLNEQAAAPKA